MQCTSPYMKFVTNAAETKGAMAPFRCGQCLACRVYRRQVWTHRIMLESLCHELTSFVTLTYDPDSLPVGGNLHYPDVQLYLKRLRKAVYPKVVRYYASGEYGDIGGRPHYHLAVFGVSKLCAKSPRHDPYLKSSWPLGRVYLGNLEPDSAQYIAGYITNFRNQPKHPKLQGRVPEFSRMSLKPGIGVPYLENLIRTLQTEKGRNVVQASGDVPHYLQHGQKVYPLGAYLSSKVREKIDKGLIINPTGAFLERCISEELEFTYFPERYNLKLAKETSLNDRANRLFNFKNQSRRKHL